MNSKAPTLSPAAVVIGTTLALMLSGCSGLPPFSTRYADNQGQDMTEMLARIEAAPQATQLPIAVGVTTKPTHLYGYEISTRKVLWKQAVTLTSSPIVIADAVVTEEGENVVVRDLRAGNTVFSAPLNKMRLNGAAGQRSAMAITLTSGMGTFAQSRLIFVQDGSVSWEHEIPAQAGVPAVVGAVVLVPWSHQFVSALDAESGDEIARVRVSDGVISHVWRDLGGVFAGSQHGLTSVDEAFSSGRFKTESYIAAPKQKLPGRPKLLRDVYESASIPAPDSAQHSIRLVWRAAQGQGKGMQLQDGALYLVFYRFVFAFEADDLSLRWVYTGDADVVGAAAQPGGLLIADREGGITMLSAASGSVAWSDDSAPASSVVILPHVFESAATSSSGSPDAARIRTQLFEAAQDRDARLVPIRLLAVELLARSEDAEATSHLLALCEDPQTAPQVKKAACKGLGERKSGGEHLITALSRHYGFLEGTRAPPVGTLAKAASNLGEKRAVGMLIAHLKDPNTPSRDLQDIVLALEKLGDTGAAEPLADFLAMYHADVIDEGLGTTLEMIPHTLVVLLGPSSKEILERVANDNMCAFGVREKARIELEQLEEAAAAKAKSEQAAQDTTDKPVVVKPEPKKKETPRHVTSTIVRASLLPVRDKLQHCMVGNKKKYFQARIVFVVEDGTLLMVSVLPKELQSCIEPLVRSVSYPMTTLSRRDTINYVLKRQ